MDKKKFDALLFLIVPEIIAFVVKKYEIDEITACKEFYKSELYSDIEREETKLWHLSPRQLFELYVQERETGVIEYPEEA